MLRVARVEPDIDVRAATDDDLQAVIALAGGALGWDPSEPNAELFRWKHLDNPAGRSAMWLAEREGQLVGFRSFLRWRFDTGGSGAPIEAVRAVDTATHPDARRLGVFSELTRHGVSELSSAGVDFVFNTPNGESRPGYLRLGWQTAGRIRVQARFRGARRLAGARVAAERWSLATKTGTAVDAVLDQLVGAGGPGLHTTRTAEHLQWRYGFEPLGYRGYDHDHGAAIYRLRRRGTAVECTVCEHQGSGRVLRDLLRHTRADYLLATHSPTSGGLALPIGPTLTTRDLAAAAPSSAREFSFSLGDIELF